MAIKWKNWTARRPVKILCVTLVPIMLFLSSLGIIGLTDLDTVRTAILFADLDKNDYFYDNYVPDALESVYNLFWLQSEEHIRNMGCLEWKSRIQVATYEYDPYYQQRAYGETVDIVFEDDPDDIVADADDVDSGLRAPIETAEFVYYDLVSVGMQGTWHYGTIAADHLDSAEAQQMLDQAVQNQLNQLHFARNRLERMPGLYYGITNGNIWFGNVPANTVAHGADFFRANPVYWIDEYGKPSEHSRSNTKYYPFYEYRYYFDTDTISNFIAFSMVEVEAQNAEWRVAQRQLEQQIALVALPLLIAFALVVILLVGAGRLYGDEHGEIHFTAIDRPWLDLSVCTVIGYEGLVGVGIYLALETAWRYNNTRWLYLLLAAAAVLMTLPLLWWVVNFTKRCKAGRFWRYTMCYVFVRRVYIGCKGVLQSLWAGTKLTLRVVLIGIVSYVAMLVCLALSDARDMGYGTLLYLVLSAVAVFLLLRFARGLQAIEEGARAASQGRYDAPIAVMGGTLGSIATSINSIADGIHVAVAERLKSERFRTELITNISHDIRTPLTSLITYTDLLKNEGLDHEDAPGYLDILIQKSARLKTLTDDLFEASKAASGNIEVYMETLDLADFLRQVLGELDERLRDSGLDFRLDLPEHAPVHGDGKLLWRVMDNLLSNVCKYALAGSRVYIDIAAEEGAYRLDMKNISEHPLNVEPTELLERFKRGDEARGGEGSGLGLSIAQSFIISQGGRFALAIDGDLFKVSLHLPKADGDGEQQ